MKLSIVVEILLLTFTEAVESVSRPQINFSAGDGRRGVADVVQIVCRQDLPIDARFEYGHLSFFANGVDFAVGRDRGRIIVAGGFAQSVLSENRAGRRVERGQDAALFEQVER